VTRVNVYDYSPTEAGDPPALVGHFESSKAEEWSDKDYNGNGNGSGGVGRGQAVLRTAQGRWVLVHWTHWENETGLCEYIEAEQAEQWLLRHQYDDAVAKYFGPIAEERGPGQPPIGDRLAVRFPDAVRNRLKASAQEQDTSESAIVRNIVSAHYGNPT
jgi:predicted HicB family RNase H-like nuclease